MFIAISKGRGKMPAFENKLPKSEIAALVTYVRNVEEVTRRLRPEISDSGSTEELIWDTAMTTADH